MDRRLPAGLWRFGSRLMRGRGLLAVIGFLGLALCGARAQLAPVPASTQPLDREIPGAVLRQQIEEDWLRQAKALEERVTGPVSTSTDARGACDGVKDGKYGFHTGLEPDPWW
jgi:hypothetical protein